MAFAKRPEVVTSGGGLTAKVVFAKRPQGGPEDKEAQGRRSGGQGEPNQRESQDQEEVLTPKRFKPTKRSEEIWTKGKSKQRAQGEVQRG